MRTRINLFKQVKRSSQAASIPSINALKEIKVGFAFLYGVGLLTVFISVAVYQYVQFRKEVQALSGRIEESMTKYQIAVQELDAKSRAYQARMKEAKSEKPAIERVPEQERNVASVHIDGSWSSVLWKLSTMTIDPVVIQRMDMAMAGTSGRRVDISGQAESLSEFKDWLETLHKYLPASDFIVENQTAGSNGTEVRFRLTAKIS